MIDNGDKALLQRAMSYLKTANDVLAFLSDYFREKYQLAAGDQITPNGEIVSVSGLQQNEKLNGTHLNESNGTESERGDTIIPPMLNLSGDVAVLHGTTDDN